MSFAIQNSVDKFRFNKYKQLVYSSQSKHMLNLNQSLETGQTGADENIS